ncbi:cell envelope integrity protein TolA [Acidiphilium sp. AL]|uniref:cell envelope integrity protein TolA n=1 Tax=Acidiphilium sp. AL TaxID=2871704 RepID=UPI0021CB8BB5|nr:cell envelope integrity protein TolA [Acidiphilium sp. AL]MCU4161004.1 cell envelope integrity protein TolA [Acidiphilium sp. AL]
MEPRLRRSAIVSAAMHLAIILLAILALPTEKLNAPPSAAVDVTIIGPHVPQQALHKGKVPAPANTRTVHKAHLAKTKPKPQPKIAPPPPPPPPPPAPHEEPKLPRPPAPAPPPPPPTHAPTPLPTPPPPPPHPPQKKTEVKPAKKLPLPPKKQPPTPAQKSPTSQKHVVKTPAPMSQSVLNTIAKLRSLEKQKKAPTARYNPKQGGAPQGGGTRMSTANSGLSAADRNAIGSEVQPCWGIDAGAPGVSHFSVLLQVVTDASGVVREARVASQDQGKLGDPIFAAYAQRAVDAVKNYQCAKLPLPPYMLGSVHTFIFRFTP